MSTGGFVIAAGHPTLLFLLLLYRSGYAYSDAKSSSSSSSKCDLSVHSSCGSLPNISYPFRLKDDPKGCGLNQFELACENIRTTLYFLAGKYYVLNINYHNKTIRVANTTINQRNCSSFLLPSSRVAHMLLDESSIYVPTLAIVLLVNCERPIKHTEQNSMNYYIDLAGGSNSNCFNNYDSSLRRNHSYLLVGEVVMSDIAELCTVESLVPVANESFHGGQNLSLWDAMDNGFELVYLERRSRSSLCPTERSYFHCISKGSIVGVSSDSRHPG